MITPDSLTLIQRTLLFLVPEEIILVVAMAMMTVGAFVRWPRRVWSLASAGALIAAILALCLLPNDGPIPYASVVAADAFSFYTRLGILLAGLILVGISHDQVGEERAPEFFGALLLMHAGSMLVASANELVFLFAALELVSIPTYLILYLPRRDIRAQEAATKYFFLSVFSSGFVLFGFAYLYGLTGLSNLKAISYLIHWDHGSLQVAVPQFALIALVFIMAGFGFRIAAVPFHFYAPDVYEGSSTSLAALLSWIPKMVGILAIIRTLTTVFGFERTDLTTSLGLVSDNAVILVWILAVVSMTLGNTVALLQENLKRLLAYSSIAHAGYLLIGVTAAFRNTSNGTEAVTGVDGMIFYLAVYALMTLGAFGVMIALSTRERNVETVEDLAGLIRTRPVVATAMALCLFSLAGIPPLAGFWGKFRIFQSALEVARGDESGRFLLLVVLGVVNAAIGAYYYLRIIVVMTFRDPKEHLESRIPLATGLAVGACAGLSLFFGLYPAPIANASKASSVAALSLPEPVPVETPIVAIEDGQPITDGSPSVLSSR